MESASTSSVAIVNVMESDEGGYRCVVSNVAGTDTSNTSLLTVGELTINYGYKGVGT